MSKPRVPQIIRKHVRELLDTLGQLGITLDQPMTIAGSGHYRAIFRKGKYTTLTFIPFSPGDKFRGNKNQLADIKRAIALQESNDPERSRSSTTAATQQQYHMPSDRSRRS